MSEYVDIIPEKSAGIIVRRRRTDGELEFLLCSPSGPYWKDKKLFSFPKGHVEETDEDELHCALREFEEETDKSFTNEQISKMEDWGTIRQNRYKTVHVFSVEVGSHDFEVDGMKCNSQVEVPNEDGVVELIDEVSDYCWLSFDEINQVNHITAYDTMFYNMTQLDNI